MRPHKVLKAILPTGGLMFLRKSDGADPKDRNKMVKKIGIKPQKRSE